MILALPLSILGLMAVGVSLLVSYRHAPAR
jgi:hypothetical protein